MALGPHHWGQTTDHGIDVLNNIKRKETTCFIKQSLLPIIIWQLVQFFLSSWAEVNVHKTSTLSAHAWNNFKTKYWLGLKISNFY